ncbi:QRFP-like peptide receptor [Glandiceps talaboti]
MNLPAIAMVSYAVNITVTKPMDSFDDTLTFVSNFRRPGNVSQYVELAVMGIIVLLGILGNTLVLLVCIKRGCQQNLSANYFLCSLAVVDLMVCTVVIPLHIHLEAAHAYRGVTDTECGVSVFFWNQSMYCTSWLLVGISIDRYYAIGHPLQPPLTIKKASQIISCTWLLSIIIALPALFLHKAPFCQPVSIHILDLQLMLAVAQATTVFLIPLVIIATAYTRIFCSLRRDSGVRTSFHCTMFHATHYTVAKRLLLVIAVFVLCWTPGLVLNIYFNIYHTNLKETPVRAFLTYLTEYILPYFNSILNPIIYALINKTFRDDCKRVICCQKLDHLHLYTGQEHLHHDNKLHQSPTLSIHIETVC